MQQSLWENDPLIRHANVNFGVDADPGPFPERKEGDSMTKWDIFCYVYGTLHHPEYRRRYAVNLKRELPRIPFCATAEEFWWTVAIGEALMWIHLHYEEMEPYPLDFLWMRAKPDYHVTKMRWNKDRTSIIVNDSLTLVGIPPQAHDYVLGNKSALEWVINQYQITTDERSRIVNDPNGYKPDDPQYIVRLVCQIVTVSLKTMELLKELELHVDPNGWHGIVEGIGAKNT